MARTHIDTSLITPLTANLAAGGNKITGLANGTAATDAAVFGQVLGFRILQIQAVKGVASISTTATTFQLSNMVLNITPTLSTSKIIIIANFNVQSSPTAGCAFGIYNSSTPLGDPTSGNGTQQTAPSGDTNEFILNHEIFAIDSPASTSQQTYSVKFRSTVSGQAVYCPPPTNNTVAPDLGYASIYALEVG